MDKKTKEFITKVKSLRAAQKRYFADKMQRDLFTCKTLEKEVDQLIIELSYFIDNQNKIVYGEQLKVFKS